MPPVRQEIQLQSRILYWITPFEKRPNIDLGTLESQGRAVFDPGNSNLNVELDYLALNKTRLEKISLTRTGARAHKFDVRGGELDLEPFLANYGQSTSPDAGPATADLPSAHMQTASFPC